MRKGLYILMAFLFAALQANSQKRIAVVLSGGGAKGAAHIGALKVIEQAGIPIDMIVGTSMGAIVGGLYSIGYTTEQLDSIFMAQDWRLLLSDRAPRETQSLFSREQSDKYILSVPFFEKPQDAISGGVIRGRNIGHMLWKLTKGYHDSILFDKLPIPFACISQDIVTGSEIIHDKGILPLALRSSMSIPGVFAPVKSDKNLLVDGGIVNNYPVDIARRMGADIVIGVDVQDTLKSIKELQHDLVGQLLQLIDLQGKDRWIKNIGHTDIYIKVNVKGYNTASFYTEAIDSLIERGTTAALTQYEALTALKKEIPTTHSPIVRPYPQALEANITTDSLSHKNRYRSLLIGESPKNSLNLGVRYDNEQLAAILLNTQFMLPSIPRNTFAITLRLGKLTYGRLDYAFNLGKEWNLAAAYEISYNDFNIYNKGSRICEVNFIKNRIVTSFARSWRKALFHIGAEYINYNYGDFLYKFENTPEQEITKESHFKFGGDFLFNNMDQSYFPTKGHIIHGTYHYIVPTAHAKTFHTASIGLEAAFSPTYRFSILPWGFGRYVTSQNTVAELNTIGGQERGKYFEQQLPFYGINRFEVSHKILVTGGIEFRQRIGKKHYVSAIANLGLTSDNWVDFWGNCFGKNEKTGYHYIGGALKYDLKTIIGPVGFTLHYSNRSQTVEGYFRAGFTF